MRMADKSFVPPTSSSLSQHSRIDLQLYLKGKLSLKILRRFFILDNKHPLLAVRTWILACLPNVRDNWEIENLPTYAIIWLSSTIHCSWLTFDRFTFLFATSAIPIQFRVRLLGFRVPREAQKKQEANKKTETPCGGQTWLPTTRLCHKKDTCQSLNIQETSKVPDHINLTRLL